MKKDRYIKSMQKAGITVSVVVPMLITMAISSPSFAQTVTPKTSENNAKFPSDTSSPSQKINNLKQRADTEIIKRITGLTDLIIKIEANQKLQKSEKDQFKSDIQKEIDSLKALKIKIAGDTDLQTLKSDVKSIVDSYRIYLLYMPKTKILIASTALNSTADKLYQLAQTFDAKLSQAVSDGKDVSILRKSYDEMVKKIDEAKIQYNLAEKTVLDLTSSGYPDNKSQLETGRSSIKAGTESLKTARNDAKTIYLGLKALYPVAKITSTLRV